MIASLWRRMDGALSRSLVPEFDVSGTLSLVFDTGEVAALKDDEVALWQRVDAAVRTGWLSTHTAQRMVGVDPHGPDVIYQPFSVSPIAIGTTNQRATTTARIERMTPKILPAGRSMRAIPYDSDEHRQRWEQRVSVTEQWEAKFAYALSEQMELQRQDVQAGLMSGGRSVREIDPAQPFDREKWIRAFKVTMKPIVAGIIADQGKLAIDELGIAFTFDVSDPKVIRAMERQLQRFAEEVNATTWDALRTSLAEGIAEGEGIGQLAERVDSVMVDRIRSSKEAIARTEVTASSTIGTQESWRQSGVVKGKEWIAALDSRTRETHINAHGQIVGIDDDFSVGGATGSGPGMMSSAAESVNCRCSIAPVLDIDMPGGD